MCIREDVVRNERTTYCAETMAAREVIMNIVKWVDDRDRLVGLFARKLAACSPWMQLTALITTLLSTLDLHSEHKGLQSPRCARYCHTVRSSQAVAGR